MPEIPDLEVYREALGERLVGRRLLGLRIQDPFVLRSVAPMPDACVDREVTSVHRIGKRLAIGFEGEVYAVLHLMLAGRLHWRAPGAPLGRRGALLAFDFAHGALTLSESSRKRRASLHLAGGAAALTGFDAGGLEIAGATLAQFRAAITRENHTLKRALTDPRIIAGIGNAYSDEILFRARLSPMLTTARLDEDAQVRLFQAARATLAEWCARLRDEAGGAFPEKVTAFHAEMAVHGKYRRPCPCCGHPVQRIRYADNECNYCAHCQNQDRLLADRGLSRLLKSDWPRTLDALEQEPRK